MCIHTGGSMGGPMNRKKNISGNGVTTSLRPPVAGKCEEDLSLLASIIRSSDCAIIGETLDGIIISWNPAAERIYGWREDEIIGKSADQLMPPEQAGELPPLFAKLRAGGRVEPYEARRLRRDGSVIDVWLTLSPVIGADGRIIGISSITRVITEEKRTAAYTRSLFEASPDSLVAISPDGRVTDANEAALKTTGLRREELIGTDFSDCFTEPEKAREGYRQAFYHGAVTDYALTIRHKSGRLTDVLYYASAHKDTTGKVLGVFATVRDVTVRKRFEEELAEQRRKELERLVELEKFQKLTVGRELKMLELKKQIEDLKKENEVLRKGDRPG